MGVDIAEQICQAVDTIVTEKLKKVSFDQTITCTIVDDSGSENGVYRVNNGSATFNAYSVDTSYETGDVVYVQIPNGNFDNDKIILSKKPSESEKPLSYVRPFNRFMDITGNLLSASQAKPIGLLANNIEPNDTIVIWSYNNNSLGAVYPSNGAVLSGYTRLGIKASFMAWLNDYNTVQGSYGLRLKVQVEPEEGQTNSNGNPMQAEIYEYTYDCSEMSGNPYKFESFYEQEILFDISRIANIKTISLEFYEKPTTFVTFNGEQVPYKDVLGNLLTNNLFVKDIYIAAGYDTNESENDNVTIFSLDNSQFTPDSSVKESDNHKKISLRWVHRNVNGIPVIIDDTSKINYKITWYRRILGSSSDTVYTGVDWAKLSEQIVENGVVTQTIYDQSWLDYNKKVAESGLQRVPSLNETWLLPDITMAEERVKAIITYDGQPYYSNILTFTNKKEVVSKPTLKAVQALTINCEDDTYGNYLIYKLGGDLLDNAEAQKTRTFKAYFSNDENIPAELTEAQSIEWIIPSKNTMIVVDDFTGSDDNYIDEDGYHHIRRFGNQSNGYSLGLGGNSQSYRIERYYNSGKSNNTIKCIVTKDNTEYTAVKELTFGPAGTSGTDYSFVLDFNNGATALTIESPVYDSDTGEQIGTEPAPVTIRAQLYDYNNQQLDLKDTKVYWSWLTKENQYVNINGQRDEQTYTDEEGNLQTKYSDYYTTNSQVELNLIEGSIVEDAMIGKTPIDNYSILVATLKDYPTKNGNFNLNAYLPIPIRLSPEYQFISGPTTIRYNSLGYLEDYQQTPYKLFTSEKDRTYQWDINCGESQTNTSMLPSLSTKEPYELIPKSVYFQDNENLLHQICVYCFKPIYGTEDYDGKNMWTVVWSQPIYIYQNKYPSSIINDWDGSLQINEEGNYILAAKIAAGRKESDNTFSGVMMGDWHGEDVEDAIGDHTGLYGFHQGSASFGFRDNGTAFIGKPGSGRIEFNGNKSIIESNRFANGNGGMQLDFDDGLIKLINPSDATVKGTISIDASAKETPFKIGSNFKVNWDGTIYAKDGVFDGYISADYGDITDLTTNELTANSINTAELDVSSVANIKGNLRANRINFASSDGLTTQIIYQTRESTSSAVWSTVNKEEYDAVVAKDKKLGRIKKKTTDNTTEYLGYLGMFKGSKGTEETDVIGLQVSSGTCSIVIEGAGNTLRIGNQEKSGSNRDSLYLQGNELAIDLLKDEDSSNIEAAGYIRTIGTVEGINLAAKEIYIDCDAEDQHGIYARFA